MPLYKMLYFSKASLRKFYDIQKSLHLLDPVFLDLVLLLAKDDGRIRNLQVELLQVLGLLDEL